MTKASVNNPGLFDCCRDVRFYDIAYPWPCVCGNPHNFILFIYQFRSRKVVHTCETVYTECDFLVDFLPAHSVCTQAVLQLRVFSTRVRPLEVLI